MEKDFSFFAAKYDNFAAPAMKIFIDGTEVVSGLGLVIENLTVSLSVGQSGSTHFNIVNGFQLSTRTFADHVKSTFRLGSILKVELGYGSDTTNLFQGYIAELNLSFGEVPEISVTALDVRRLLMDTVHQNYVHTVTSYSKAFQEVMKNYERFYDSLEVEATDDNLTQIVQKDTDYRFIQEQLCAKANKEFFVSGGTVYFRTPAKEREAIVTLEWGEGLMSFEERKSQCNQKIRVYGRAENKRDSCMVEVTVKTADAASDFMVVKEYQNAGLIGEHAVRQYADKLAGRQKAVHEGGSGTCIGLPELIPGEFIRLENLDSANPKEYYIKSVKHSFGSGGYTTQFDVEGCNA